MAALYARIAKRCRMTADNWRNDMNFSGKLALLRFADDIGGRLGLRRLSACAHSRKEAFILHYLGDMLAPVIEKYRDDIYQGAESDSPAPIWVCWWSGEESAPALVKQCISSIRRRGGGIHPINLITEQNYSEYIAVPEHILHKLKNGSMCMAHFTDYLRVCLLAEYGGLWLDATMFCAETIPEEYFDCDFFTCRSEVKRGYYLSDFQWVTFCLGGHRGHVFYRFMKAAFECYWSRENAAIDYLFFDDLIYIAKSTIPAVRDALDSVPLSNLRRDDLQAAMNAALPAEEFWNVVQEDTVLYKLSWREAYTRETHDGKPTVYDYFLKMKM